MVLRFSFYPSINQWIVVVVMALSSRKRKRSSKGNMFEFRRLPFVYRPKLKRNKRKKLNHFMILHETEEAQNTNISYS